MRWLTVFCTAFSLMALAGVPARAGEYQYSSTIKAPGVKIATIQVTASEMMKNEKERWGPEDVAWLKKDLAKKITRTLQAKGLKASEGARLEITLVDVIPNRPTAQAMSKRLQLDFLRSSGIGGATVDARLVGAGGTEMGRMHYRWKETQSLNNGVGNTTWYDARHTFDNFARRLAKALKTPASS